MEFSLKFELEDVVASKEKCLEDTKYDDVEAALANFNGDDDFLSGRGKIKGFGFDTFGQRKTLENRQMFTFSYSSRIQQEYLWQLSIIFRATIISTESA